MSLDEKARLAIANYRMLDTGDEVLVGISGGADSVCLLHFLCGLAEEMSIKITAAHLNHGLRGAESDRDENFVKDFCQRLNVDLITEKADIVRLADERGVSIEEAGREARYAFFAKCRRKKIAVAHNLDDSVETMLINLSRGSALRGLCGIPPVRICGSDKIIRPLILCERDEIEAYCGKNSLDYITDSSNLSDDYTRNRLRHHVMPELAEIHPSFLQNASRALEAMREDADYLDFLAAESLKGLDLGGDKLCRKGYLALPKPVGFRVLISLLAERKIPADSQRLSRLDKIIRAGTGAEQLAGELYFKTDAECFSFEPPPYHTEYFCIQVDIPQKSQSLEITVFSDKKLRVLNTDYEYYEENMKNIAKPLKNALDCDRIDGILKLRQKNSADAVKLAGRGCTKTLKKLFQESGISPSERERVLILEDLGGIVWAEGFGVAERAAVSDTSTNILLLAIE